MKCLSYVKYLNKRMQQVLESVKTIIQTHLFLKYKITFKMCLLYTHGTLLTSDHAPAKNYAKY